MKYLLARFFVKQHMLDLVERFAREATFQRTEHDSEIRYNSGGGRTKRAYPGRW